MASPTPIWARFWVLFGVYFIVAILQKRPWDWPTYSAAQIAIAIGLSTVGASVAATPLWLGFRWGLRASDWSSKVTASRT
jgi:hypothetical protein